MAKIIYNDGLKFDEGTLPVHLASDRQVYVQLGELCRFIGVDPMGKLEQIQEDGSISDLLLMMSPPGGPPLKHDEPTAAFLNLAALPYWLGRIHTDCIARPEIYDCLVRYSLEFLDVSWMLYRAALYQLEPSVAC